MGKASVLMVIGFNMIFMALGFNIARVSTTAYENFIEYNDRSTALKIAQSGANMACSEISFTPNWRTGYAWTDYLGGRYKVAVSDLDSGRIKVKAESEFAEEEAVVELVLGISSFSKFAYYSVVEGSISWITGDTVRGPFHTQAKMTVAGSPTFYGKVTAKLGLTKSPSSSKPNFYGGFQKGVTIDLPSNLNPLVAAAGSGGAYFDNKDVWLDFKPDGKVVYRIGSATATPTTTTLSALAPNGVILSNNGSLHIKGVVNGKVTISATGSTGTDGMVFVDSSVTYNSNPASGASTDMLGIVADRNILIEDNANNTNVTLHASVFSRTGGVTAENHSSRPKGRLQLLGGMQQYQRGAVGTFSGSGTLASGFQKDYQYDERLYVERPPFFPTTGSYEVLSWYE
ncbi:MAG: hypothetical protein MUE68_12660 [Bacteroidetes bacterium]|jgi:hypothetical protein|nr:hypothetical protein [Bacteroidota bacterium]